jgi:hypothetical protein
LAAVEDRQKLEVLEAKLKEKEGLYEQDVQKYNSVYEVFENKTASITRKEYDSKMEPFENFNQKVKSAEEIIGGITYKLDSIDNFNEKMNDLNEIYSNLQQIKWKKYRYMWTPKLLHLFWSFIVFTLGVDYALSPFEGKYLKVAALALVWILLEFYFVPMLTKYLDKKQYQSFDTIFKLLYTNKVILLCNIELYEYYQKK